MVTMRCKKAEVKLFLEIDISRNFRVDVEIDNEEFTTRSDLQSPPEDSNFVVQLNDSPSDSDIESG